MRAKEETLGALKQRIAELELGLTELWFTCGEYWDGDDSIENLLAPAAKEQGHVDEHFDVWQPEIVIIKRKDGKPINNWEPHHE